MISAFKRLVHTNNGQAAGDRFSEDKKRLSGGFQPMGSQLQKKFSKGVQYNMKIIIRGDKNVGKSNLFLRLQGEPFKEEYIPTEEIQVANIEWSYNVTDELIKVEVWNVVDKGKKRKPVNDLKLNERKSNSKSPPVPAESELALDAEFVDVYKNTNGVILMFDLSKQWTFDYVEKEIENIPKNIPVIILGNHRDQGHHGLPINEDKVKSFIETIERESSGQIRYAETSMRNGFGLKFLYKWFNLPFLHLKKQCLLKQLATNEREIDACCQELTLLEESDDQNYERFLYTIQNRRREIADSLSQVPKTAKAESNLVSKSVPFNLAGQAGNPKEIIKPTPSIIIGANNPLPIQKNYPPAKGSSVRSPNKTASSNGSAAIENETEDQAKLRQFLEDAIEVRDELSSRPVIEEESDNEEESTQPKILGYQDELDEEDRIEGQPSSVLDETKSAGSRNDESGLLKDESGEEPKDERKENGESNGNDGADKMSDEPKAPRRSNDRLSERTTEKKVNGHKESDREAGKESRRKSKESKVSINLVDSLPDKSILESHVSKSKKSRKSKKSSKDGEKLSRKKSQNIVDELLGPYVSPIDEGPTGNEDEYFAL